MVVYRSRQHNITVKGGGIRRRSTASLPLPGDHVGEPLHYLEIARSTSRTPLTAPRLRSLSSIPVSTSFNRPRPFHFHRCPRTRDFDSAYHFTSSALDPRIFGVVCLTPSSLGQIPLYQHNHLHHRDQATSATTSTANPTTITVHHYCLLHRRSLQTRKARM